MGEKGRIGEKKGGEEERRDIEKEEVKRRREGDIGEIDIDWEAKHDTAFVLVEPHFLFFFSTPVHDTLSLSLRPCSIVEGKHCSHSPSLRTGLSPSHR